MTKLSTKTRGSSKLFKSQDGGNETAIVTYREDGETKTAVFKGEGCAERATEKMQGLRENGATIVSYTAA